jgi:hypothetical protein
MFKKSIGLCVVFSMICIAIAGYAQEKSPNRIVSEKLIAQIDFSSWGGQESLKISPDSKRVAYAARAGQILGLGGKWFVVVDGKEEKQYDAIVTVGGGRVIFDSPDSLHYLAHSEHYLAQEGKVYLVEEEIN